MGVGDLRKTASGALFKNQLQSWRFDRIWNAKYYTIARFDLQ